MSDIVLEDDQMCFVCGTKNQSGLKLNFVLDNQGVLKTEFTFLKQHQGFKDIVHGGLIGLILDEVMVNLLWKLDIKALAAEFTVRLKKPCLVGKSLRFSGWIEKQTKSIIYTKAQAKDKGDVTYAQAWAKCIKVK